MTENLINDLLDLAKFENNTFKLSQDYFSLSNTVLHTFKMILHQANQQGITLRAEIDSLKSLDYI